MGLSFADETAHAFLQHFDDIRILLGNIFVLVRILDQVIELPFGHVMKIWL